MDIDEKHRDWVSARMQSTVNILFGAGQSLAIARQALIEAFDAAAAGVTDAA